VTTRASLRAASASAGSCECTYVAMVNADNAWPSQAAITAIGTPSRCIKVPFEHFTDFGVMPDPVSEVAEKLARESGR
jgi:hypothetical protein